MCVLPYSYLFPNYISMLYCDSIFSNRALYKSEDTYLRQVGNKMSLIGITKLKKDSLNSIEQAILTSLKNIQFTFPKGTRNIIIKPNLCYYLDYSTGHTSDPKFVGALINVIRQEIPKDVNISVIESDASAMKCRYAFPLLGYDKLAQDYDVKLVNLTEEEKESVDISVNGCAFTLKLPRIIKEADLRISVPKIKYMSQTGISCALKNLYGCNPLPEKYKLHKQLAETIVALNKIMKFDLHILDGLIVCGTTPKKLDLVMSSQDPVALDAVAARISGLNPKKLKQITLGEKEGLGNAKYTIKGINPDVFAAQYPKPTTRAKMLTRAYLLAVKVGLLSTDLL